MVVGEGAPRDQEFGGRDEIPRPRVPGDDLIQPPPSVFSDANETSPYTAMPGPANYPNLPTDLAEIHRALYGDLGRLAATHTHPADDWEDILSDAFLRVLTSNGPQNENSLLPYLKQAIVNRARSRARHRVVEERNVLKLAPSSEWDSTEEIVLQNSEAKEVWEALMYLPDRQREVMLLRFFSNMSEAEIAAKMRITRGSVKSHAARAMATLSRLLDPETKTPLTN